MAGQKYQNGFVLSKITKMTKTKKAGFPRTATSGANLAVPFALVRPLGPIGVLRSSVCSNMATNLRPSILTKMVSYWRFGCTWETHKKACFVRYSVMSPHRATKPSRGWLRVVLRKPRFVLAQLGRHEIELRRKQGPTSRNKQETDGSQHSTTRAHVTKLF